MRTAGLPTEHHLRERRIRRALLERLNEVTPLIERLAVSESPVPPPARRTVGRLIDYLDEYLAIRLPKESPERADLAATVEAVRPKLVCSHAGGCPGKTCGFVANSRRMLDAFRKHAEG